MTIHAPGWWQFALLALAAFRVYRLIARDTITEPVRAALTYPDGEAIALGDEPRSEVVGSLGLSLPPARDPGKPSGGAVLPRSSRVYLSTLVRCPWCVGAYLSAAWWLAWSEWPRPTEFAATPWALSAVLALLAKLDE